MKNKAATVISIILLILIISNLFFFKTDDLLHDLIYNFCTFGILYLTYFINKEKINNSNISNKLRLLIKTLLIISLLCLLLTVLIYLIFYPDGNKIINNSLSLINSITFLSFLYIMNMKI
jgi:hypothetical protein